MPDIPERPPEPEGGMAWDYRIPVVNNRYTWIRWGWVAVALAAVFVIPIGILAVMYGGSNGGAFFAVKLCAIVGIIAGATVVGLGLFSALGVSNDMMTRFALSPEGVVGRISKVEQASIQGAAWFLTTNAQTAQRNAQIAELLLPTGGDAKWKDVRRVQFDEPRHVITLRRRWHNPLRIYAPAARFGAASTFVREHVPASALPAARGPTAASDS